MKQYTTTAELLATLFISEVTENDMFCNAFCEGCEDGHGNLDYECPAAWLPGEDGCARRSRYEQFCKTVEQAFADVLR